MTEGHHWRTARPGRACLAWVAAAVGAFARVVSVRAVGGGGWSATHAVNVDDARGERHRLVLRRWARPGWEEDPNFTAAREAAVLERLSRSELPVPRVVGVDPDGGSCDVPALLMTRLPGRPPNGAMIARPAALHSLAAALAEIHALDQDLRGVAAPFEPFYETGRLSPPEMTRRRDRWADALAVAASMPPVVDPRFMHRDYHPGNTLWIRGRLTGIVDWTSASFGPRAADLGHLLANLGVDHGPAVADAARAAYESLAGEARDQSYWDIRMLLDFLPDSDALLASESLGRVERYLASLLERPRR